MRTNRIRCLGIYEVIRTETHPYDDIIYLRGDRYNEIQHILDENNQSLFVREYVSNPGFMEPSFVSIHLFLDTVISLSRSAPKIINKSLINYTFISIFHKNKEKRQVTIKHLDELLK